MKDEKTGSSAKPVADDSGASGISRRSFLAGAAVASLAAAAGCAAGSLAASLPAAAAEPNAAPAPGAAAAPKGIRLIIRGDDIGFCHACNVACIKAYKEGVLTDAEVIVPGPWYTEAVEMLKEVPGFDIGLHLDLTAEWEAMKWGPVSGARSLVDKRGHFFALNVEVAAANPTLEDIEKELRAQIEIAKADIPQLSHLSTHMGTANFKPEWAAIVQKLSKEYNIPTGIPGTKPIPADLRRVWGEARTDESKEAALIAIIEGLTDGTYIFTDHCVMDADESRVLATAGNKDSVIERGRRHNIAYAFASKKARAAAQRRGVQLVGYADCLKSLPK